MDVGPDRADGGRPEGEGDAEESTDGEIDLRAALEDVTFGSEDGDGTTDPDPNGESDVDDVFEEFEEASPEEIVERAEDPDAGSGSEAVEEATDEEMASLFGDLDAVELDPGAEPADASDPDPEPATAETGTAPADGDATGELPDPDEMADEVEGLLGDLGSVEVEAGADAGATASGDATAETRPTVLDTGEASAFQWLGEDVQIFSPGAGEAEELFEGFEEATPEELIDSVDDGPERPSTPDVSATDLFAAGVRGESPSATVANPPDPAADPTDGPRAAPDPEDGVVASALFADLPGEGPRVTATNGTAGGSRPSADDDGGVGFDLDGEAAAEHLDLELDDSSPPVEDAAGSGSRSAADDDGDDGAVEAVETDLAGVDASGSVVGESDVDAVFERFEESSPEEIIEAADEQPAERHDDDASETVEELLGDLGGVDLEREAPSDPTGSTPSPAPGSEAAESEVEGLLGDLSSVDLDAEVAAEPPGKPSPASGTTTDAGVDEEPAELERTGEDTHVAVGESDVDAVFERFEESSPEEIAASGTAASAGGATADDASDAADDPFSTADAANPFAGVEGEGDETSTSGGQSDAADAETGDEDGTDEGGGIVATIKNLFSGLFG